MGLDSSLVRFLLFLAIAHLALGIGMLLRRGRPYPGLARRVHLTTVSLTWAPLSFFSFWRLQIGPELVAGFVLQILFLLVGWLISDAIARWRKWSPREAALFCAAGALSNQGFTMGAFICYNLLPDGATARDYAVMYVTFLAVLVVLLAYPLVNARAAAGSMRAPELLRVSFLTPRAAPLYAALGGLVLNTAGRPAPDFDYDRISLYLFNFGAAGAYFGIGLNLPLLAKGAIADERSRRVGREMQIGLALVKFAALPIFAWVVLSALLWTGPGLHPTFREVIAIESMMPAAITSVVIASFFQLDAEQAGRLWLGNTILFLAGPLWVLVLAYG